MAPDTRGSVSKKRAVSPSESESAGHLSEQGTPTKKAKYASYISLLPHLIDHAYSQTYYAHRR